MNSGGPKEACVTCIGTHWRHLANTTEPSVCCGDAALRQITLTTCLCFPHTDIVVCNRNSNTRHFLHVRSASAKRISHNSHARDGNLAFRRRCREADRNYTTTTYTFHERHLDMHTQKRGTAEELVTANWLPKKKAETFSSASAISTY